ncbi:MAG: diacylglycerol kinase family protein [Planctomycetota bacterium]|nr:diacylglycerol kinase family protein [Planctomycetota bacterium]
MSRQPADRVGTVSLEIGIGERMSPTSVKNLVIIAENPRAGATSGHRLVVELTEMLEALDYRVRILTSVEEIQTSIQEAQRGEELACIVSAGGDGTLRMIGPWADPETPIAIIPLGTENLMARYLGFTVDVATTAKWITKGNRRKLDAGLANGQFFLVMASVGFDADVVTRVHEARTGHIRHWSYALPLLTSIRDYRYPELRIRSSNHRRSLRAKWAFVFNVPMYAMGLPIVPDADDSDGRLDLCSMRNGSLLRAFVYLAGILMGRHRYWNDVHSERAESMVIEADEPVNFQLDGDPGGQLPLTIEALESRLTFVTPANES